MKINFNLFYKIIILTYLSGVWLIGCDSKEIPGNRINASHGEANNAPMTRIVNKSIAINSPLTISLIALSSDIDGDELTFFTIGNLPKHGTLLLVQTYNPSIIYHSFTSESSQNKFDGHELSIQYLPNKDFIGKDKFSYQVTDARGLQSKSGQVRISVDAKFIQEKNHPPIAHNLTVITHVKESVYIDMHSIAVDVDGDAMTFSYIKKYDQKYDQTYTNAKHGKMILGTNYIDYLPQTTGVERIPFYVCSKGFCDKSVKGVVTIQILVPSGILGKLKDRNILIYLFEFLLLSSIYMVIIIFAILLLTKFFPNQLKLTGILMVLLGPAVFYYILARNEFSVKLYDFVKLFILCVLPVVGGGYCIFSAKCAALWPSIANLMKKQILIVLLVITNTLIIFYHFTGITLPAIALDIYIPIYNFFKYDIIGHDIGATHNQRLLIPFLTSLLPFNTVLSFKVINSIFINMAVIVLYRIWKDLNIKLYLIVIAFLWLFLHAYGVIRYFNFYPTTIYAPSYFFNAALVYVILKKQYKWLLLLLPIGALQHNGFMLLNIAFLGYKILASFFGAYSDKKGKNDLLTIGISNFLMVAALQLPHVLVNSQLLHDSSLIGDLTYHFFWGSLGYYNFNIVILLIMYFACYGGLLLVGIQKFTQVYQNTELYHGLLIFLAVHVIIAMSGSTTSFAIFWAYPFIMTLILLSINQANSLQVIILFVASIPLLRITADFPFVQYPSLSEASRGPYLSLWGIYMIVLYLFSFYLMKTSISHRSFIRFLKKNINIKKDSAI